MLRILLLLVLFSVLRSSVCSGQINEKPGEFTFSGHIDGRDTGVIVLGYLNMEGRSILDTGKLKDGYFSFRGTVSQPTIAQLIGNVKSRLMDDPGRRMIFIEVGNMTAQLVEGQFKAARITGSGTQLELDSLEQILNQYWEALDRAKREGAAEEADLNLAKARAAKFDFIRSMPNSFVSPFLLTSIIDVPLDSLKKSYESFSQPVKQGYFGRAIQLKINNIQNSAIDKQAYEFVKNDWKSNDISLAQFKGEKYVLLDFWASWCVPCRNQLPDVKKIYQSYHDRGLEIIGVSADWKDENWKKAIVDDDITQWHHVLAGNEGSVKDEEHLGKRFYVESVPTLILIDKQGKIIYRDAGGDGGLIKLENLLAALLGKD